MTRRLVAVLGLVLGAAGCRGGAPFFSDLPLGADPRLAVPRDNPLTPARVELGRRLFFDPALSADATVACATCHQPARAFTDGRRVPRGVAGRVGKRNVPTLVNRAYGRSFFWDGRVGSLEEQVLEPLVHRAEMANTHEAVLSAVDADSVYAPLFREAFGAGGPAMDRVAQALASFLRTLVAGDSPLDRYMAGDSSALSPAARRGLALFRGEARCSFCHTGSRFTDELFHNTGVAWRAGEIADSGRYAVSGRTEDVGAFKTPTLREVERTAPYMHDGSLATLEEVVDFYDRGGNPNPHLDPLVRKLDLDDDGKKDLVAFLKALTGRVEHPGSRR